MMPVGAILFGLVLAGLASGDVQAGAWAKKKGQGQAFLKWEAMRSTEAFDAQGLAQPLLVERKETTWSLVTEYGLTDRMTLQVKGDWQQGQDAGFTYEGRGPVELGLMWQVWRDDQTAIGVYVGAAQGGDARNAGYALPGQGGRDYEVRALAGRAVHFETSRFGARSVFAEVQMARRFRESLSDETRMDLTVGSEIGSDWLLLGQAFGGVADNSGARWLSLESSAVRHFGSWSAQLGWRRAVLGRDSPRHQGLVLALWRRF